MPDEKKLTRSLDASFPGNSNKSKEPCKDPEKKKVPKIATGKVTRQKRTFGQKVSEAFLGDDTQSVGDYLLHDVLIPAMKSTLSDMVGGGIEMLLFGERRSRGTYRDRGHSYVSYGSYFGDSRDRDRRDNRRELSRSERSRHDFDNLSFETRGEAEDILSHLVDLTVDYNVATVADYYDLAGVESQFTDNKYGWTNLRDASVDRVRQGYTIRLPQPRVLD